jgi:hypothetical protein
MASFTDGSPIAQIAGIAGMHALKSAWISVGFPLQPVMLHL